jgi:hypothetical protein
MQASGSDITVSFATVPGRVYQIEWTATLDGGSWAPVGEVMAGTGSVIQITDTNGAGQAQRFYRLVVK